MRKPNHNLRGAFTLVELLVVIAIMGLLVSIVLPSLGRAKELARRVKCRTNLHAVGVGLRMYLDENKDIMPIAAAMPSLKLTEEPSIAEVLRPFLEQPDCLRCPSDTETNYWRSEGASYEYRTTYGGKQVSKLFLTQRIGEQNTPVMYDYEPFHGPPGEAGSAQYLFADGHVGNLE